MPEETQTETAEENKTEETTETTEAKVEPKPSTAAEIAAAVAAAIKPADNPNADYAARINAEATRTGKTVEEVVADDNARRESNLRDNLPMYERLGAVDAKEELGDRADLLDEVKALMATFPAATRANPQAWKDAASLTLGRHFKDKKPETKTEKNLEVGKVVGGKVNAGLTEGGKGGGKSAPKKDYPEFEQHLIDKNFGGDAAEYEKYKAKDSTKPREIKVDGQGRANDEYRRLTKGAKI